MQRPSTPEEANVLYDAAVATNGPFTRNQPLNIKGHEGPYIVTADDREILDLHGHILAHYMMDLRINVRIEEVLRETGTGIIAPNMTHPEIDLAKVRIAGMLDDEFGGGPWEVDLISSGTRANEDALSVGRAVLGGEQHVVVLNEGYHGSGGLRELIGHGSWQSRSSIPLGIPITFLDHEETDEGRDYTRDYDRLADCHLGPDGKLYQLTEFGVGGVMGFKTLRPKGLREMIMRTHERGGFVTGDIVQVAPFRTGEGILAPYGIVDKNDPRTIPDAVVGAKGMGFVGQPLAFVAFRKASLQGVDPRHYGKSYDTNGRNVLAAAAFNAGYEIIMNPEFQNEARANMQHWRDGLETIQERLADRVRRVTGLGYMSGLKLDTPKRVADFSKTGATETGVICAVGGLKGDTLRLGVKLDSPRSVINEALMRIEDTLKKT